MLIALQGCKTIFEGCLGHHGSGGLIGSLLRLNTRPVPIDRGSAVRWSGQRIRLVSLANGARASVLGDDEIATGPRLGQLSLQRQESAPQSLCLGALVFELLGKALRDACVAQGSAEGLARHVVPAFAYGKRCLLLPGRDSRIVLGFLAFEKVLIGDRDGDLRLDLQKLVLHIKDELLQHLLGILSLVDQVVDIRSEESGNAFHECHEVCAPFGYMLELRRSNPPARFG